MKLTRSVAGIPAVRQAERTAVLPDPKARPQALIVLFDGECGLCRGSVERLNRWDSRRRLSYLALDSAEVITRFPNLQREDLLREMHVIDRRGECHRGAAAWRIISRAIPRLWPVVPLFFLPGSSWVSRWLYGRVAALRYKLGRQDPCGSGECRRA